MIKGGARMQGNIAEQKKDRQRAREALNNILSMEKRLPDDFDAEKELNEARMENFLLPK